MKNDRYKIYVIKRVFHRRVITPMTPSERCQTLTAAKKVAMPLLERFIHDEIVAHDTIDGNWLILQNDHRTPDGFDWKILGDRSIGQIKETMEHAQ